MANIKQIAELAGVSITTVSRVLNNHPYVQEAKREAVWDAVHKLNYSPNSNAVHLVKGRTGMVAVLLPFVNHPFAGMVLEGIAEQALVNNYRLILCQTNYDQNEEKRVLDMLKSKQIDGVIIVSRKGKWEMVESYASYGPIVACEKVDSEVISYVHVDRYKGTKECFRYLVEKGYRQIGFSLGTSGTHNGKKRMQAYLEGIADLGERVRPEWIFENCYQMEDGSQVVQRLAQLKERPQAIMVAGDLPAAGMITEAKKLGWGIPEDLAITGFDNLPLASILDLTTMNVPSFEAGKVAFQLFIEQIPERGNKLKDRTIVTRKVELPLKFITRGSA
ncbi:LacI family DNA-binding transcriptional regulator [Brevibacillus laterosporus]|uniref:LacI family DNA-binding transcriptional regulator n=1 Tax=Brevibacillus laterosporus TaxID=1465 RepID=UPI000CE2F1C6|nr:LacI family DNA-binding transcriptional regulator [Brevibacillus laterosporus]MED1664056.1 LacI family DNA-binding transcriptional regulator [Brevibacillus laterosporus]MED1669384.1 LacI family DNA-binding transcriptional regulator [Brevibacillus laterosporus]MED1716839.1 LacI family DNA-binding transcriptional regulator [Brevibacillus laterosporus]PPA86014.1 LacI family transcriptional regulator [Brevibacillus laterosporus]